MLGGVRHHHEKFNGSGYPEAKKGEQIPLTARIIAVADAFNAMTSDRAYRASLGVEHALKELELFSGKQFEPQVVGAFMEGYRAGEIMNSEI